MLDHLGIESQLPVDSINMAKVNCQHRYKYRYKYRYK